MAVDPAGRRGLGKNQLRVLAATAAGPTRKSTIMSRTGLKGPVFDTLLWNMCNAGFLKKTGGRGDLYYENIHNPASTQHPTPSAGKVLNPVIPPEVAAQLAAPQPPVADLHDPGFTKALEDAFAESAAPPAPQATCAHVDLSGLQDAISGIARGLAIQIAAQLVQEVSAALPSAVTRAAEKFDISSFAPKPTGPKLKKVVVVGLRDRDMGHLTAEYATKFDLRFVEGREYNAQTRGAVQGSYAVIVCTDHINHSMVEFIKSAGVNPTLTSGGMTTIKAKLEALPA